jgi:hypothetical protein
VPRQADAIASGDPTPKPAALGGVAGGQVDDGLRPPQDLAEFTDAEPVDESYGHQPHGRGGITDRLEQRHLLG